MIKGSEVSRTFSKAVRTKAQTGVFFKNRKSQSQASGDICKTEGGLGNLKKFTLASTNHVRKKKKPSQN